MKLTDRTFPGLKPGVVAVDFWDATLPRFGCRVSPRGLRTFGILYRVRGEVRRLKIGTAPPWSLHAARERAQELLRLVDDGKDPAAVRAQPGDITIGKLVEEFFEAAGPSLRPKTLAEWRRLATRELKPTFRKLPANEVSRAEVKMLLGPVVERAPVLANRLQSFIARVFAWGVEEDRLSHSPVAGMPRRAPESSRDRYLAPEEIAFVWQAAREVGGEFEDVVRLLLLTGVRLRTVLHAPADEFDLGDRQLWTIPPGRMKAGRAHLVPLSDLASSIIKARLEGGSRWLFPSRVKLTNGKVRRDAPTNYQGNATERIRARAEALAARAAAEQVAGRAKPSEKRPTSEKPEPLIPHWTLHDLRRSIGTGMLEFLSPPVNREIVALVLGHSQGGPAATAIYDRSTRLEERREALQRWADWLKRTTSGLREVPAQA